MIMKSIENFLEALQKKFYPQKYYHPSQLELDFARPGLKKLKKHGFNFCKLKKAQKSSKNMDLIFASL